MAVKMQTMKEEDKYTLSSTSKGNQLKWFKDNKYIKADTMGYESIAEVMASEFLKFVDGVDFVDYSLCVVTDETTGQLHQCCYADNFLKSADEECVSFYHLLKLYYGDEQTLNRQVGRLQGVDRFKCVKQIIEEVTGLDQTDYLGVLTAVDYLLLNEDRHLNNICVIKQSNGWRYAPIFDNGLGLLADTTMYKLSVDPIHYVPKVKAKPFSTNFRKQWEYAGSRQLHIDMQGFLEDIKTCTPDFKEQEFNRALRVLKGRCKQSQGKVWVQKV